MNTAQELFSTLQQLPLSERQHFFELLAGGLGSDSQQDHFSHAQVFGDLQNALFTAAEAAEYLEISIATFRRYVRDNKISAASVVGSSHLFALDGLRELKKALKLTRRP